MEGIVSNRYLRGGIAAGLVMLAGCTQHADRGPVIPDITQTSTTIPGVTVAPMPETTTTIAANVTTVPMAGTTAPAGPAAPGCNFGHNTNSDFKNLEEDGTVQLQPNMYISEIRFGDHNAARECWERIVFELADPNGTVSNETEWPGIKVEYVDNPMKDPLDEPVVMGDEVNSFLEVRMGSMLYGIGGGQGVMTFNTENKELDNATEIAVSSNFEGYSTVVIGVINKAPFALGSYQSASGPCSEGCYYVDIYDPN